MTSRIVSARQSEYEQITQQIAQTLQSGAIYDKEEATKQMLLA
jgi:hypothetical protein